MTDDDDDDDDDDDTAVCVNSVSSRTSTVTQRTFPVSHFSLQASHCETYRRAAVCNLHYTQLRKHDYSHFNVVLINLSKDF